MVMMVLFVKPKYSSLISSTYCSLVHLIIRLTSISVVSSCTFYAAFLAFCDSWTLNILNVMDDDVKDLLTRAGFGSQSMVADESLVTFL